MRGTLLLAEAHLRKGAYPAALDAVRTLDGLTLDWERAWLRQYWLARILFESGELGDALKSGEPLPELATRSQRTDFVADANDLLALVLARLGRTEEAIVVSEKNLDAAIPADRRRNSLLNIAEMSLSLPDSEKAVQWLERFLKDHPKDTALDVVRLTLGELRLREYFRVGESKLDAAARIAAQTNQLALARAQFDGFVRDFPQSPLAGKGNLNRGIALWEDGKIAESEEAFRAAVAVSRYVQNGWLGWRRPYRCGPLLPLRSHGCRPAALRSRHRFRQLRSGIHQPRPDPLVARLLRSRSSARRECGH